MALQISYLIINCGTSSIKMSLFDGKSKRIIEGEFKNLFSDHCVLKVNGRNIDVECARSYRLAINAMIRSFEKEGFEPDSLKGIGHRVVHGGEKYVKSTLLSDAVVQELKELSKLAPLHNPASIEAIECAQQLFPHVAQVAVFDTAFHATLPPKAALYPLPLGLSQKHKIKRYGFHGIAHHFAWNRYWEGVASPKGRVITLHLGSGSSLTAIHEGVSVDTTMGFTPLDGLMMATRSGELDPAIVSYLCSEEGKTPQQIIALLNQESGLLGVSGKSADMRQIVELAKSDEQAKLALDMFIYHVVKHVGAFIAVLGGIDALIFSGGIGERSPLVRRLIMQALLWCGIKLDEEKNEACQSTEPGSLCMLGTPDSTAAIAVVGSDENLYIYSETIKLVN